MLPHADRLRVVLVSPRNPLNIGAAARAISNFGFAHLRLVNAYEVAFQEARSAVNAGAILQAARQYPTLAEAVADCSLVVGTTDVGPRTLDHAIHRLELGGRLVLGHLVTAPVALVFGSEKYGLSNDDLSHCHWLMRIPTREAHGSMNLGQAVAVCLYELVRSREESRVQPVAPVPAPAGQVERLTELLLQALTASGYVHPPASAAHQEKIRRLVRRLDFRARDIHIWLGMLRQVLWRLGVTSESGKP